MRDQRIFKFKHGALQRCDAFGVIIPARLGFGKIKPCGLRLNEFGKIRGISRARFKRAIPRERRFQIDKAAIKSRLRQRRREIADERRARTAFGNCAFRRIIRGIEIEVRCCADESVWPARGTHARLFTRHEFKRAVCAEMQYRIGCKIFAQITIKSRERMRGRETMLEEQAHRIAFIAKGGLHADKHITEALTEHMDG